eukprot:284129-Pelagomonas_calceolata.AAC.10
MGWALNLGTGHGMYGEGVSPSSTSCISWGVGCVHGVSWGGVWQLGYVSAAALAGGGLLARLAGVAAATAPLPAAQGGHIQPSAHPTTHARFS